MVLMLSLLGVKGYEMAKPPNYFSFRSTAIDRDDLLMPEAIVESFDADVISVLKPLFDSVWQASGWQGSPNFDDKGARKARR